MKLDSIILDGDSSIVNIVHDLAPDDYLRCLAMFTHFSNSPFWNLLHSTYGYDSQRMYTAIILRFIEPPSYGLEAISQLLQRLMNRSADAPGLLAKIWSPLSAVNRILHFYRSLQDPEGFDAAALPKPLQKIPSKVHKLIEVADLFLQTFINKQVPALTHTVAETLVMHVSQLRVTAASSDDQVAAAMLQAIPNASPELKRQYGPAIIELAWKFQIFQKCFQEGRMEIRVQGVELMQQELVNNLYSRFMNRDGSKWDHPVAQYIANIILENRLVQYLVGVESHVQLITRCGNIFGFLAVTHRYTEAETDAIWKAVCTSQDSRVVDAILNTLNGVVPVAQYHVLLYLTTKLNDLPIHSFDSTMIHYAQNLLNCLPNKWKIEERMADTKMDMPPYHLCIRLIRQSAANIPLGHHKQREITAFATHMLKGLLEQGPSDVDRKSIYEECVKDIASKTQFATGSISAILALFGDHSREGIVALASTYNISSLLIEEFASLVETGSLRDLTFEALSEHLGPRLSFFTLIFLYAPQSIDLENGQRLWDLMLGPRSLTEAARDRAWISLAETIRQCLVRNIFIDRCLVNYLPTLPPSSFATRHSLVFLEQVIRYESRAKSLSPREQALPPSPSGVELLWHLSVVVPPMTIEFEAINKLVSYYLNLPNGQRSLRTVTESIYNEVVERCIRQLTMAASKLKAYSDGTSSGEDESMVIVVPEEDWVAQRLCFTRSLLIMKEFVKGARSKPSFSPPRQTVSWVQRDDHNMKGRPMSLPYQTFNGCANSNIYRISVGEEETIEDLSQQLQRLSGFAVFTLIAGGRRLDLEADAHRTLKEMKIDQNSFLLVKRVIHADSAHEVPLVANLKPLEGELMKHFATLYSLLMMEDGLAREVNSAASRFGKPNSLC